MKTELEFLQELRGKLREERKTRAGLGWLQARLDSRIKDLKILEMLDDTYNHKFCKDCGYCIDCSDCTCKEE